MQQVMTWWCGLSRRYQVILGAGGLLVVGLVVWGGLILSRPAPTTLPVAVPPQPTAQRQVSQSSTTGASLASQVSHHDTRVFVDVQGAVAHPGLYQFAAEMRVADAIKAAGGLTAKADRQQVNLASRLTDQQQLTIPQKGEHPAASASSSVATATGKAGASSGTAKSGDQTTVVNLNTATVADLQQLTGVGEKKAQKIVDYRTAHGSFQTVKDLAQVPGFGEKTVANLQDQLTT
ncbi:MULTISPECIES: ComEA family DNA-binding protein [Lactobacillaceae]|uniref:ComEA family DNA-binding protein n=1 Tax=Lactobacillaceae TaxID=33958 RepID=UPI00145762A5|nr:ComEA family DNA-binding protein [Lactobacillus sp. HBUAS51381]NLR09280.1 ComEA family DNA-binding protein [Lactobacillus sp. HBUAS51381]